MKVQPQLTKEHHDGREPEHDDPEVVAKTLIAEHSDFLREAVAIVAHELMEAEIGGEIGARRGERSADRAKFRPLSVPRRVGRGHR